MGEQMKKQNINFGLFAHVDAGKTTLSEQLLACAGAIRATGSVDAGTAHTDTLPVERRRGISVKAACVSFPYRNRQINLIDTPGHVDFSAEVERSLWALDAAVLVVCAVEGVQPQTEVLFEAMRRRGLPVIFFLNKTDRDTADPTRVLGQIHRLLTPAAVDITDEEALAECLCGQDDALLERYLDEGSLEPALVRRALVQQTGEGRVFPVLAGSALKNDGVAPLLDTIVELLPAPRQTQAPSGVVFAAKQDRTLGRGVWVRLFGGTLENRTALELPAGQDPFTGEQKQVQYKITQIHTPSGEPAGRLGAGDIGVVYGLGDVPIGHIFGDAAALPCPMEAGVLRTPLITVQVLPEKPEQMPALHAACKVLSGEDPLLQVQYVRSLGELHLKAMGTIQLEVLEEELRTRFALKASFTKPAIIYKETAARAAEGFVAYTMPKPCWAILRFTIEPAPRDSGVQFVSQVPVRELAAQYQHQVEQALPLALAQGRLGWQVTDVKITLTEGNSHQYHTHPLDFIVATPMGVQDGLQRCGSVLLEPILAVRFLLPAEHVGRVMTDVATMQGEVLASESDGDRVILNALVPVRTSLDYAVTLAAATGGRGAMSVKLHGYRECPRELGAVEKRRGVDPLDSSKYILAARSALEGGIFDI